MWITCLRWDSKPFFFHIAVFFLYRLILSTSSRKGRRRLMPLISWQRSRSQPPWAKIWGSFLLNHHIWKLWKTKQLRTANTTLTATATFSGIKYGLVFFSYIVYIFLKYGLINHGNLLLKIEFSVGCISVFIHLCVFFNQHLTISIQVQGSI